MKNQHARALIAALAAATTVAGTAVPVLADNEVPAEQGQQQDSDKTEIPSSTGQTDPKTAEDQGTEKADGKTLTDGDKVTVKVTETKGEDTAAEAGTAEITHAGGQAKIDSKEVTVDHDAVADGTYVYRDGNWYPSSDTGEISQVTGEDGQKKDASPLSETAKNGIKTGDKTPSDGDILTTSKKVEASTETVVTVKTSDTDIEDSDFSVDGEVAEGTYTFKKEKEATSEDAGDAVAEGWYLVTKGEGDSETIAETPTDGIKFTPKEVKGENEDAEAKTTALADGDQITVTHNTVAEMPEVISYRSAAKGALTSAEVDATVKDGSYIYNADGWYPTDDGTTVREGSEKVTGITADGNEVDGDTIKVTGQKDAEPGKTVRTATVESSETKNKIPDDRFVLPEDIEEGTYTYSAEKKTWVNDDRTADITVKEDGQSPEDPGTPEDPKDNPGTGGQDTPAQPSNPGTGTGTAGGNQGGSSSGSISGGSSSGSGQTAGGSSEAGGTANNGEAGNNGGSSNQNGENQNGGNSNGGSESQTDTNTGKTSDEVDVERSGDDVTGLDVADGELQDGKYVTSDGVILVNEAVATEDGIVITDKNGEAVPANSKVKFDGKTYLINEDGVIASSQKVKVGKKTYVARKNGTLAKKAFVTLLSGNRVYTNRSGSIVKNRVFRVGKAKYVAKKSGALVKNGTYKLGSKRYTVKNYKVTKTAKVRKAAKPAKKSR